MGKKRLTREKGNGIIIPTKMLGIKGGRYENIDKRAVQSEGDG